MTDLDAIRARDAEDQHLDPRDGRVYQYAIQVIRDRRALLAEVDRLTAELPRAIAEADNTYFDAGIAAERARIRAAVEGLPVQSLVGMTGDASVDNYVDRAAVLAALAEYDR